MAKKVWNVRVEFSALALTFAFEGDAETPDAPLADAQAFASLAEKANGVTRTAVSDGGTRYSGW